MFYYSFVDFIIKWKNYKLLNDIIKVLINFEITTPLTKELKLTLGFNFDIAENYSGDYYDTPLLNNRYYELSILKSNFNYEINKENNIDFTAKFSRKNYNDIQIQQSKVIDKLVDLDLNYNRKLKVVNLDSIATIGAKYFSKDITPAGSGDYEGAEFYTKLNIKF